MLTQAKLERENAPLAVPLASTGAASGAPEGSAEALLLAKAAPTAAELERAAAAAMASSEPAPCTLLRGVQPTVGLLVAIKEAADANLACARVPAVQALGRVCAALSGIDRQLMQPGCGDAMAKRVNTAIADHNIKLRRVKDTLGKMLSKIKKNGKLSAEEAAAKEAACRAKAAAEVEELRAKATTALQLPLSARARSPPITAPSEAPEAAGSCDGAMLMMTTRFESEAASSLQALKHTGVREERACRHCSEMHADALEARREAAVAAEAKRMAEEAHARAWVEQQRAQLACDNQVVALRAEHEAALERMLQQHEAALERAKQQLAKERSRRKEAQETAEKLRKDVTAAEARQRLLCSSTYGPLAANQGIEAALAKAREGLAEAKVQHEQQLGQLKQQHLDREKQQQQQQQQQRGKQAAKHKEEQAKQEQAREALKLELQVQLSINRTLEGRAEALKRGLQGERVRRGRYEAQLGRQRGSAGAGGAAAGDPRLNGQEVRDGELLGAQPTARAAGAAREEVSSRNIRGAVLSRTTAGGGAAGTQPARASRARNAAPSPLRSRSSARSSGDDCGRTALQALRSRNACLELHIEARDLEIERLSGALRRSAAETRIYRCELRQAESFGRREAAALAPAGARTFVLREIRNARCGNSPLEPYSMEMLRRLMEEAQVSFGGVNKCISLVWLLLFGETPMPEELLISRKTMASAFLRLDQMDARSCAAKRRAADAPWAVAADGGNKGHAVNVIAVSSWDFERGLPRVEPLNVKSLNADQSARNCAETVSAALASSGLNPARCTQAMTDGCDTAIQEGAAILEEQHQQALRKRRRAEDDNDDDAAAAAAGPRKVSRGETCCIHGKALEERDFLEAAFPLAVDGLRLLWEIIKGDEKTGCGRVDQYRAIWKLAKLRVEIYDKTLATIPEFTTAKWGCMREGCKKLVLICQRGRNNESSMLQKFLAKCVQLFNGSCDDSKERRVVHSHRQKIHLLYGIFSEDSMHAAIFALSDVWNRSYDEFFRFVKSPSRYGGFEQPHLRHMIAEQVTKDLVYYRNARAQTVC